MHDNPVMGALLLRCSEAEPAEVERSMSESFPALAGGDELPLLLQSACNLLVARLA